MKQKLFLFILCSALSSLPFYAQDTYDPLAYTTGSFHGCAPQGRGGDPDHNVLKNRDLPPPDAWPTLIDDILGYQPPVTSSLPPHLHRASWPQEALDEVVQWESTGGVVEGYLIGIRSEGAESCNCGSTRYHDYHLWIAANPNDSRSVAVVVEISPRLLAQHPGWRQTTLTRLANQHARVRISGWFMWDEDHPEQLGVSRGTLWEVHPIHRIEVYSGGRWRTL